MNSKKEETTVYKNSFVVKALFISLYASSSFLLGSSHASVNVLGPGGVNPVLIAALGSQHHLTTFRRVPKL